MRIPYSRRRGAPRRPLSTLSQILTIASFASGPTQAVTFTPAPSPNIDLSNLGNVGIVGDFSGISLYEYLGQNQNPFSTNGSEALMARMPNGIMAPIVQTDASIVAMCTYSNGQVVLAGNFTSLGGQQSTAIALFDPSTSQITPMPGLSGQVVAVLCDRETVYVGGKFKAPTSMNAMSWRGNSWQNLPFGGFNGEVNAITKASNGNVIFGGKFTGLGNVTTPGKQDMQIVNLQGATITSGSSTSAAGFSNPRNILCKTDGGGPGSTWLLQDRTPGFWQATFRFGFKPTKLRLYNTRQDGRGTKTWRMTALPLNGIMNFTYIDQSNQNRSCTSECPLSNDPNVKFQDFRFVNSVGMNAFRIDISDFHGNGGGLDGIELFQDDIFSYAINEFNEPNGCAGSVGSPNTTSTGQWGLQPSGVSNSDYLKVVLDAPISESSASIVFTPNIRESGSYSVDLYTPGCQADGSCATRGQINIKMTMQPGRVQNLTLYQTNDFDKYDQIYFGNIEATSTSGFRPTVTMTPLNGQSLQRMTFVAHRIGFVQLNSTGGLNGLYEHNPGSIQVDATSFAASAFNKLGSSFATDSAVTALATAGDITYIGGNFSATANRNILALNSKDGNTQTLNGGLNGAVESMILNGTNLFVGGSFSGTQSGAANGLNNVAVYDTFSNRWSALGAGVNGLVKNVVAVTMNITSTTPEVVVAVTGEFTELSAFGENRALSTDGFGIWVPSQNNWLRNLNIPVEGMEGTLASSLLTAPGGLALYGGAVSSSKLSESGTSTWSSAGGVGSFGIKIQPKAVSAGSNSSSQNTKRDTHTEGGPISGVTAGAYDTQNGRNKTILAGHFTATSSSGTPVQNLVIIDNKKNQALSGLGSEIADNSTFVALVVNGDNLFAGGNVSGTVNNARVNGLISYNLASNAYNTQPSALSGGNLSVTSIAMRPKTSDLYVGGGFTSAGSLGCAAVCMYSVSSSTWNRPGTNLQGTANSLLWTSENTLVAGGTLRVNDSATTFLASYNTERQNWDSFPGASSLPGPVELLTLGSENGNQIWATGTASNGSVYLMKYDGSAWFAAGQTLAAGTKIRGLQIFSLTQNHNDASILDSSQVLMLTGSIGVPGFGTASAATFNGTHFTPFLLTTNSGNTAGTVAHIFVEHPEQIFSNRAQGGLPLVGIVLIALAISLGLILLIVAVGLALDRYRKKREGYMPAPTSMIDRGSGMQRIPPHELLESLGRGPEGAPRV